MSEVVTKNEHMQVFRAAASMAGFEDEVLRVVEYGLQMDLQKRIRLAQGIVDFTEVFVCEGQKEAAVSLFRVVTKDLISLRFDGDKIEDILQDYSEMVATESFANTIKPKLADFVPALVAGVFTLDHLIDPSSHQIIHLRQLATDHPLPAGIDPNNRWSMLLGHYKSVLSP